MDGRRAGCHRRGGSRRCGRSRLECWRSPVSVRQSLWWKALRACPLHMSADWLTLLCSNSYSSVSSACAWLLFRCVVVYYRSRLKLEVVHVARRSCTLRNYLL